MNTFSLCPVGRMPLATYLMCVLIASLDYFPQCTSMSFLPEVPVVPHPLVNPLQSPYSTPMLLSTVERDQQSPDSASTLFSPYPIVPSFQEWRFPHGDLPLFMAVSSGRTPETPVQYVQCDQRPIEVLPDDGIRRLCQAAHLFSL